MIPRRIATLAFLPVLSALAVLTGCSSQPVVQAVT